MADRVHRPTRLDAWRALKEHHREIRSRHMRDLFRRDKKRFDKFSVQAEDILLDYSKNLVNKKTMRLLVRLAREAGVRKQARRMFGGKHINTTEDRAVLHTALRAAPGDAFRDGSQDATADVLEVLDRLCHFTDAVHEGRHTGATGKRVTDVVNIGIGGSDLGIVMVYEALAKYRRPDIRLHCVSNVDGTQLEDVLADVDPETTLFIVCSKTFTTQETLTNAHAARRWLVDNMQSGEGAVQAHFAAVSTNHPAMDEFGIHPEFRFGFWDWVGGRYSVWSAVGLAIALAVGADNFRALLAGGRAMDRHFLEAPLAENLPVILALIAIWYNNFFGAQSFAVLPYDNRLLRFPAFLQQLQMESNGKSVNLDGKSPGCRTGAVIWGEPGSNAQHSFYQLLHQGTRLIPADFIAPVNGSSDYADQHQLALANCFAQTQALMAGQTEAQVREDLVSRGLGKAEIKALVPHKVHAGNRPTNTILIPRLTPEALGKLVALYEHKVFVEGVIWGINSFDQWGVELGKKLAKGLEDAVRSPAKFKDGDSSTIGLLQTVSGWRD